MKKYLLLLLSVLLIGASLLGCNSKSCPKIGDKAPDFTLNNLAGKSISLSGCAGKPVVINTWDMDCIRCKEEMPFFGELFNSSLDSGIIFISIDTGNDSISSIKDYLSANKFTFDVYQDYGNKLFKPSFCLPAGNPCTVFIDKDGVIKQIKIGSYSTKTELEQAIKTYCQ